MQLLQLIGPIGIGELVVRKFDQLGSAFFPMEVNEAREEPALAAGKGRLACSMLQSDSAQHLHLQLKVMPRCHMCTVCRGSVQYIVL